ncbi:hypothetical protein D3C86_1431410 [compost metagenome]
MPFSFDFMPIQRTVNFILIEPRPAFIQPAVKTGITSCLDKLHIFAVCNQCIGNLKGLKIDFVLVQLIIETKRAAIVPDLINPFFDRNPIEKHIRIFQQVRVFIVDRENRVVTERVFQIGDQ